MIEQNHDDVRIRRKRRQSQGNKSPKACVAISLSTTSPRLVKTNWMNIWNIFTFQPNPEPFPFVNKGKHQLWRWPPTKGKGFKTMFACCFCYDHRQTQTVQYYSAAIQIQCCQVTMVHLVEMRLGKVKSCLESIDLDSIWMSDIFWSEEKNWKKAKKKQTFQGFLLFKKREETRKYCGIF